jgi:hypothetical protein
MRSGRALCGILSLLLAAGCQGSGLQPEASAMRASLGKVAPARSGATQQPLIYTSDAYVYAYTFAGQQVAEIQGFSSPAGLCSDANGDVYVADAGADLIYEFARGGSQPINVLNDAGQQPNSCAVDPTTGNIAVTNIGPSNHGGGNVIIYPPGSGKTGIVYSTPNISRYEYCAYDGSGNLYVDGERGYESFHLAELRSGSTKLADIAVTGLPKGHHSPEGVQWDGQYVVAGDSLTNTIYRIAVSGSGGKIVRSVRLAGWKLHFHVGFVVQGKRLLFPFGRKGEVAFYAYPAGGRPKGGFFGRVGGDITVSL